MRSVVSWTAVLAPALAAALGGCSHTPVGPGENDAGPADAESGDAGDAAQDAGLDAGLDGAVDAEPDSGFDAGDPIPISPNTEGWWRDVTAYEIFVRSFADSNGDGIGDLAGLTGKLDYLNDGAPGGDDLGVGAVWLMPIQPSPSYHGYDVTEYRDVNPQYGTLADFDALIAAAHARGIRVILDFVLNHSSSRHPWFESSRTGPASPRRDWYLWRPDAPDWRRPWDGAPVWHASGNEYFYAIFWSGMPDLNLANREVEAEMVDAMRFWLARGADGFRIDAARYLIETSDGGLADQFETHALAKRFRAALHAEYPEALFIAEAWTSMNAVAGYYGRANEYQLAFSFDLAEAIKSSINDGLRATLRQTLAASETTFPDRGFEAPFLSNHDMTRVMQVLGGDSARARLAAALLFAMPGTPFIYYGEELGMQGGLTPRDEDKRTPFRWDSVAPNYGFTTAARSWYGPTTEAAGADVASGLAGPASLLALYRTLIQVRAASPAFAEGDADLLESGDGRGVVALMRADPRGRALFVANLAAEPAGAFSAGAAGTPRVLLQEGLIGAPRSENGSVSIDGLAPRSFAFIALDE